MDVKQQARVDLFRAISEASDGMNRPVGGKLDGEKITFPGPSIADFAVLTDARVYYAVYNGRRDDDQHINNWGEYVVYGAPRTGETEAAFREAKRFWGK